MIRISVSDLDSYQYYKANEDMSLDQILARLRREERPSPAMLAGRALHSILEHANYDDEAISVEGDGFRFHFDCDVDLAIPIVRELKGELEIETPSGPVTLVGVVDGIDTSVHDYKLTGQFDAARFADSYQWRCYLLMFGLNRFVYRVFVGQEQDADEWTIREYHELPIYRYPGMEEDVYREVAEFAAFLVKYQVHAREQLAA